MHSDGLYEKFKEDYNGLFLNSDLVLSLPYSISLFGWTASVFGWPILNQPIPLRGYIGFKKNDKNTWVQIKSYKRMSYKSWQIEQSKNDPFYAPSEIFLEKLSTIFSYCHADIYILTEFETRNADIISGGIILWLEILYEKIDQKMINFLKKSDSQSFYENEYVKILLKNTLSLRMNYNKFTIGWSSLDAFISGLMDSDFPILHMQEKNFYPVSGETVEKKAILKKVDDFWILYITRRADELMDAEFNRELPFDIMMFSLGDYRNVGWYQTFLNWWENSEHIKKTLFGNNPGVWDSFFIQPLEKNHLLYKSIEIISSYVFHVTKIFLDTLLAKEKVGTLFFYLRRNMELINTLLGKYNLSSHEWEDADINGLELFLRALYPDILKDNYFIYTTGSSIELKYVILFPKYLPKYSSEQITLELQKKFQKPVSLLYSSKNDGMAHEGLKIEQFLQKNIFYKNAWDKNILLIDKVGSKILCSSQDDAMNKSKVWILVDTINQKIFINGEKLNSKDLLSQNATVDVLSLLLENLWSELESWLLPRSGYSKNKNEMVSKIIIPLMKLVDEKMSYQLPLTCKGNAQNFFLKLEKLEIDIFVMKKR